MKSHGFGAFVQHESHLSKGAMQPASLLHREEAITTKPSDIELDDIQWGERLNGPAQQDSSSGPETMTIPTPRELEHSRPSSPKQDNAVDAMVQSATYPPKNKWRLASLGLMFFIMGAQDAVVCLVRSRQSASLTRSDGCADPLYRSTLPYKLCHYIAPLHYHRDRLPRGSSNGGYIGWEIGTLSTVHDSLVYAVRWLDDYNLHATISSHSNVVLVSGLGSSDVTFYRERVACQSCQWYHYRIIYARLLWGAYCTSCPLQRPLTLNRLVAPLRH